MSEESNAKELQDFVYKLVRFITKGVAEPNPVRVACTISEGLGLRFQNNQALAVERRAREVAKGVGDWCGGYYDPMEIANLCLGINTTSSP